MAEETAPGDAKPTALAHVRVVELGGMPAAYAGAHLGALGADVIKVEPPGGDPARLLPPFAGDVEHVERGIPYLNANLNKRSIALDPSAADDADRFASLLASADLLVEATPPGHLAGLGFDDARLLSINPSLVTVSITPFGQWGPYSAYRGNDAVAAAMSGIMTNQGDDTRSPVVLPCQMSYQIAAIEAAYLGLAALRHRRMTGQGQRIDVSLQEALTFANVQSVARYSQRSEVVKRPGAEGGAFNVYRCKDGRYVFLAIYFAAHWHELTRAWMDDPVLSDPEWDVGQYRTDNVDVVQMIIGEFVARFDAADFVEEAQRRGLACTPVNDLAGFVGSEHMRERGWFQTVDHPVVGTYEAPGPPVILSRTPYRTSRPAPTLDQHREEILSELSSRPSAPSAPVPPPSRDAGMLEGIRVADLTRVFVGPIGTQMLGFYGAEVVKVESADLPANRDTWRAIYPDMNRNKRSCTIDLRNEAGKALFERLVDVSDVVVDNFSSGVMGRLGVGYEELSERKPGIIQIGMPGLGSTGPQRRWVTYGNSLQAYTGLVHLWGHPESPMEAHAKGTLPDYVGAAFMALATMAAIEYRDRTGEGQSLEICMVDGQGSLLGPAILDYTINGRSWDPVGYDEPLSAHLSPYGCYPCRNPDTWVVIACESDDDWRSLVTAMREPPWAAGGRFDKHEARRQLRAELDERIGAWTAQLTPHQALRVLQANGVPAGMVMNSEQLYHDPHLRARWHLVEIDEPPWGRLTHQGLPGIPSVSRASASSPTPWPGADNAYVFGTILGMSAAEIADGESSGAIH